jgi:hypothetical protein
VTGRIDELEEAIERIGQWCDAFPADIFREPAKEEFKRAHEALAGIGLSLDIFSASSARHACNGVKKIVEGVRERAK